MAGPAHMSATRRAELLTTEATQRGGAAGRATASAWGPAELSGQSCR